MVIVHIASIKNDDCSGVPVAVPQHIIAQQKIETVGFINLNNYKVDNIKNQLYINKPEDILHLDTPFDKIDLFIIHEVYRIDYIKIYKILKSNNIPYVIIPHGTLTHEAQKKKHLKKRLGNFFLFSSFIKNAVAIQYLSEKEKNESMYGKNKIIGSNGVFIPSIKKEYVEREKIKIVYIGNLALQIKGLDLMLDAIKRIEKIIRDNSVSIYLYGPNYKTRHEDIRKILSSYNIEDIVLLNDKITGVDKKNVLLDSDLFIQTSRSEGMSMGILEALSYGIPCILTEGTNMAKTVDEYDAGWGCENTVDSIAKAILDAINERERWIQKSENAYMLVKNSYSWSHIANQTILEYRKILKQ